MKAPRQTLVVALTLGTTLITSAQGPGVPSRVVRFASDAEADPTIAVSAGERLRLHWANLEADAVLVGVGRVPPTGEHEVTGHTDTSYTLISGDGAQVRFRSIFITVEGRRGPEEDEAPGLNRYANTIKGTIAGAPAPDARTQE